MTHSEVVELLLLLVCYFSSGPPSPGRIKERKLDEFYPRNFLDTFIQLNAWEKNPPFKKSVNMFNWKSCTSPCLNVNYRFRMAILRNNHFFLSLQGIKFTFSSSPSFSIQENFFRFHGKIETMSIFAFVEWNFDWLELFFYFWISISLLVKAVWIYSR